MFSLWIGGYPATEIAAHTPPTWETLADGGIGEITFALALSRRSQHQALKNRALVQVKCGPLPVATGLLSEPDRTTWECHAFGLAASLGEVAALDSGGSNTRDVGAAVARAMSVGWPGTNPSGVTGVASGDEDGNPVTVARLLDDYADQTGQRWGVDGRGCLFLRADPSSPRWLTTPGAAAFGTADEGTARRLLGRFDSGAGTLTASAGSGLPEDVVDLTDRGPMTLAQANAILAGALGRMGVTAWTNPVDLHREQLTTRGGTPAFLPSVTAGEMLRAMGLASGALVHAPWLDVVIGKTVYTVGSHTIRLEPVNTAPRNLADVIAAT